MPIPDPEAGARRSARALTGDLPSPLDSRARAGLPEIEAASMIRDAEQYRPKLIEVAPGHLVAEHD